MSRRISIAKPRNRILASSPGDLWSAIQQFRQTHDLSDLNVEEVYAGIRDPSSPRNAERLLRALDQARRGEGLEMSVEELRREVLGDEGDR